MAPVAGRVGHHPLAAEHLNHVGRTSGSALGDRIERHPDPVTGVESVPDRVLLDMVDADPFGQDPGITAEHVEDHPGPLVLVGQVGGVDEDQLIGPGSQLQVFDKNGRLVTRVLVEPDLTDPEHVWRVEELRDQLDDLTRQRDVLSLLGIDAKPRIVLDAVCAGALGLVLGELAEVVAEPFRPRAIETGPERGLADHHASRKRHPLVVVGRARNHVDMGIDVRGHGEVPRL